MFNNTKTPTDERLDFNYSQEAGEVIFVPSGWHHTVENLQDTLSINHNWLNGFNLHWAWKLLRQQYLEASEAISDCRALCSAEEFEGLVQRNMAANAGLDFRDFSEFLGFIAMKELQELHASASDGQPPEDGSSADRLSAALHANEGAAQTLEMDACQLAEAATVSGSGVAYMHLFNLEKARAVLESLLEFCRRHGMDKLATTKEYLESLKIAQGKIDALIPTSLLCM